MYVHTEAADSVCTDVTCMDLFAFLRVCVDWDKAV